MQHTGETWRLGRRPALDGLRGVAILLVLVAHSAVDTFNAAGSVGVTVFFTLSGFLITTLLLEEHRDHGRISLRRFYARRARRLFPALAAYLAAMTLLAIAVDPRVVPGVGPFAAVLGYFGNWYAVSGAPTGALGQTWSLAIEEQFYLVWPLLLIVVLRHGRRFVPWLVGLGIVASLAARVVLWHGGAGFLRVYFGTDTSALGLLVGCSLGVWMCSGRAVRAPRWVAPAGLTAVVAASAAPDSLTWVYGLAPVVVPPITAAVLWGLVTREQRSVLSLPALVWVGRLSYSLYLWHYLFTFWIGDGLTGPRVVVWPVMVACAFGCAWLSYRFVEQPLLRARSTRRPAGTSALPAAARSDPPRSDAGAPSAGRPRCHPAA